MNRLVAYHGYEDNTYLGCFIPVPGRKYPVLSEALSTAYGVFKAQSSDEFRYDAKDEQPRIDGDDVEEIDGVFARISARIAMQEAPWGVAAHPSTSLVGQATAWNRRNLKRATFLALAATGRREAEPDFLSDHLEHVRVDLDDYSDLDALVRDLVVPAVPVDASEEMTDLDVIASGPVRYPVAVSEETLAAVGPRDGVWSLSGPDAQRWCNPRCPRMAPPRPSAPRPEDEAEPPQARFNPFTGVAASVRLISRSRSPTLLRSPRSRTPLPRRRRRRA